MKRPAEAPTIVLARTIDGRTELVEWIRQADTVWIVTQSEETVIGPEAWKQVWAERTEPVAVGRDPGNAP